MAFLSPYAQPAIYQPAEPINTFVPLPYEALAKAGAVKQGNYDALVDANSKLKTLAASVKAASFDQPFKQKWLNEWEQKLAPVAEKLKQGDMSARYDIIDLNNQYQFDKTKERLEYNAAQEELNRKYQQQLGPDYRSYNDPMNDYYGRKELSKYTFNPYDKYHNPLPQMETLMAGIQDTELGRAGYYKDKSGQWFHSTAGTQISKSMIDNVANKSTLAFLNTREGESYIKEQMHVYGLNKDQAIAQMRDDFRRIGAKQEFYKHGDNVPVNSPDGGDGGTKTKPAGQLPVEPGKNLATNYAYTIEGFNKEIGRLNGIINSGKASEHDKRTYTAMKNLLDEQLGSEYTNLNNRINLLKKTLDRSFKAEGTPHGDIIYTKKNGQPLTEQDKLVEESLSKEIKVLQSQIASKEAEVNKKLEVYRNYQSPQMIGVPEGNGEQSLRKSIVANPDNYNFYTVGDDGALSVADRGVVNESLKAKDVINSLVVNSRGIHKQEVGGNKKAYLYSINIPGVGNMYVAHKNATEQQNIDKLFNLDYDKHLNDLSKSGQNISNEEYINSHIYALPDETREAISVHRLYPSSKPYSIPLGNNRQALVKPEQDGSYTISTSGLQPIMIDDINHLPVAIYELINPEKTK